ncbi:MAG: ribulose bisphosphate carboxylase small subunit [Gammaproteobacteria bacterium]|nr:ribulose bisphosphate carboxylase small subunit [Gammaproteobacteria bacterium]PCH62092.1 MAG: ribulose bisphosphate carboxylase small subunit [Gammaproteobacteria bacterium]PCH64376.1 MAG: ribulose bisphosphate carboxylase small subunit [Gammaproteobacteria bacterium]
MRSNVDTGDYRTTQTLETFGFLPQFTQEEVQAQIAYMLKEGLTPSIEHEDPAQASNHYWPMWKLPFFGEQDLASVVAELDACRSAYPDHHVRLIGYDSYTQSQGVCFVAYRGKTAW